jgi:hypothetical protein
MSTLSFKSEDAVAPEKTVVYQHGKRVGVIRLTENKIMFRVDPDVASMVLSKVQADPVVEITAEELKELSERVASTNP